MSKNTSNFRPPAGLKRREPPSQFQWIGPVIGGLILGFVGFLVGGGWGGSYVALPFMLPWGIGGAVGGAQLQYYLARQQPPSQPRINQRQREKGRKLLERKRMEAEWSDVPDGAISRARSPRGPEPTDASLSRSDSSQEEEARPPEDDPGPRRRR